MQEGFLIWEIIVEERKQSSNMHFALEIQNLLWLKMYPQVVKKKN